jgi:mono/diheme cytochrome c family protein
MRRSTIWLVVTGVWLVVVGLVVQAQSKDPNEGWKLPANAAAEKNPFPMNEGLLAAGKKVYTSKCARCHGPAGEGDGVDADIDLKKEMDLTRPDRAAANPEGIVFFKVWTGRQEPRMPAFEDQLTKDQAWAVVAYTQTLRKR